MSTQCPGDEHPERTKNNRDVLERACREELAQAYRNLDLAFARVKEMELQEREESRGPQGIIDALRDVRALKQAAVLSTVR